MRLFIGLELGPDLQRAVEAEIDRLRPLSPDSKWVNPQNAHLTLAFLGHTAEETRPAIEAALLEAATRHAPFELAVRGGGGFGSKRRPRVLWTDVQGDTVALAALQQDVADAMRRLGFELERRPYRAHLTLARARGERGDEGLARCVEALEPRELGTVRVDQAALFESKLSPKGARYTVLLGAPLRTAAR